MITLILIIFASIANAAMDTIMFHYPNMIFPDSWKVIDDEDEIPVFKYKVTPWHIFKSIQIILFIVAAVFYKPLINWCLDILAFGAAYDLTFNLFFHKIFKK